MDNRRSVLTEENANGILLISSHQRFDAVDIAELTAGRTVVCDFPLPEAKEGQAMPWGYKLPGFDLVDHHAPDPRWYQHVTSTSLAVEYIRHRGPADRVILNHTDCDSILAALILRGLLPPEDRFVEASMAADHTGEPNEIADLLQAIEHERSIAFSVAALTNWLETGHLPERVRELVAQRQQDRLYAERVALTSRFFGKIAVMQGEQNMDSILISRLSESPWLVIYCYPLLSGESSPKICLKVRLGQGAPSGLTLHDLNLSQHISGYGGRWNAGSNFRRGGTEQSLEDILLVLNQALDRIEEHQLLARAIAIAAEAHVGQVDKGGNPYVLHPLRVMAKQTTNLARIVGVLHDVVEDGPGWTFERLADEGFPDEVLTPLRLVTDEPRSGPVQEADYLENIRRIAEHPIAKAVKLADVQDNLDRSRIATVTEKDEIRFRKYEKALVILLAD